jgi:hypothetical protein
MASIRVPIPSDPERRRAVLERALNMIQRYGSHEGTLESGTFQGTTLVGSFAGSYRCPPGAEDLEIEFTKKPWIISYARIEAEVYKFLKTV